jgi:hypothetical protein
MRRFVGILVSALLFLTGCGIFGSSPKPKELTAKDHTALVNTLMENYKDVFSHIDVAKMKQEGRYPSANEVMNAMLVSNSIPASLKNTIRDIVCPDGSPGPFIPYPFTEPLVEIPPLPPYNPFPPTICKDAGPILYNQRALTIKEVDFVNTVTDNLVTAGSPSEMLKNLELIRENYKFEPQPDQLPNAVEILDIAIQLYQDGANTIYSPENEFYKLLEKKTGGPIIEIITPLESKSATDHVKDVAGSDIQGCVGGGIAGGVAGGTASGGVFAVPGAVSGCGVGGVGTSIGAVAKKIFDWLLD